MIRNVSLYMYMYAPARTYILSLFAFCLPQIKIMGCLLCGFALWRAFLAELRIEHGIVVNDFVVILMHS